MRTTYLISTLAVILIGMIFAFSQSTQSTSRTQAATTQESQPVKARKLLVKNLPKGLQGVALEKGVFKLKEGYKFVPHPDGTVGVALKASGEVSGTFSCGCYKEAGSGTQISGACKLAMDKENRLRCEKVPENPCNVICFLEARVNGLASRLAIF